MCIRDRVHPVIQAHCNQPGATIAAVEHCRVDFLAERYFLRLRVIYSLSHGILKVKALYPLAFDVYARKSQDVYKRQMLRSSAAILAGFTPIIGFGGLFALPRTFEPHFALAGVRCPAEDGHSQDKQCSFHFWRWF